MTIRTFRERVGDNYQYYNYIVAIATTGLKQLSHGTIFRTSVQKDCMKTKHSEKELPEVSTEGVTACEAKNLYLFIHRPSR